MRLRPISMNAAKKHLAGNHRHLKKLTGWLFGVEILDDDGRRIGIACAGRPKARMLQDGVTCEITRVCTDGTPNACSFAYGGLRRAAAALGYTRVITYIRADEPGTSVKAAGFVCRGPAGGGEWGRETRKREAGEDTSPKIRWTWEVK